MATPAVEQVLQTARHLSPAEFDELLDLLEAEREARMDQKAQTSQTNPLLALVGAWADMGDAAIDAFDAEIERSRSEPGREVDLEA